MKSLFNVMPGATQMWHGTGRVSYHWGYHVFFCNKELLNSFYQRLRINKIFVGRLISYGRFFIQCCHSRQGFQVKMGILIGNNQTKQKYPHIKFFIVLVQFWDHRAIVSNRRYSQLCGLTSSSIGHFWCSVVTSIMFSSSQ